MRPPKIKAHQRKSPIQQVLERKPQVADVGADEFVLSFKYFDPSQGQTFLEWEAETLMSDALTMLQGRCRGQMRAQLDGRTFKEYPSFPEASKTDFKHPNHVPEDAQWASMHVGGQKPRIIGHIVRNVFYVVFLDKEHRFWISEKK